MVNTQRNILDNKLGLFILNKAILMEIKKYDIAKQPADKKPSVRLIIFITVFKKTDKGTPHLEMIALYLI